MIIYLSIALALSFGVVKTMLWLKVPRVLSVIIGIVCFLILISVGIILIKDMDAPPARLNRNHTRRVKESSEIMKHPTSGGTERANARWCALTLILLKTASIVSSYIVIALSLLL